MNGKLIAGIAVMVLVVIMLLSFNGFGLALIGLSVAGDSDGYSESVPIAYGDIIEGTITNVRPSIGKFNGTGVYDRNCVDVGGGLTNCHGGIQTARYGVLNFNYVHNMSIVPCIKPGEKLVVEVLDSSGRARVQRMV